jgi:predicted RNase H-like nuclease (RuvC/YqgF family)
MSEEYEILPHQLLQDLKGEVEQLKRKLTHPDAKANELILEIESMKDSIHELNAVFSKALDDARGEEIGSTITSLKQKVENVVTQNETIAKALIAISDKLDNFVQGGHSKPPPVVQHNMGPPPMPGPARNAPPPMMGGPPPMGPPPPPTRRQGIFK